MRYGEKEKQLLKLTEEIGTPFYLFRKSVMLDNLRRMKNAFSTFRGEFQIAYALKANPLKEIAISFAREGTRFDILSPGELDVIRKADLPVEKVIYTSVGETRKEFRYALEKGVRTFVIGSLHGFENLVSLAEEMGICPDVMLRVNPQFDIKATITTAGGISKFGVPLTGGRESAENILPKLLKSPELNFLGFHFHLGTQVISPTYYVEACRKVIEFARKHDISFSVLDIGGGFPVEYVEPVPPIEEFGLKISRCLNEHLREEISLIAEPGRFLVAEAGSLITSVINIKELPFGTIVVVDASYNQLPDVLIGQRYPVRAVVDAPITKKYRIAGNLCDGLDWLEPEEIQLPMLKIGDILVFEKVGAYSNVFRMSFGNFPLPPIVWEENGETKVIRGRVDVLEI